MGDYNSGKTGFLFADPGFMQGFASALDLGGTLVVYNESATPQEADTRALASDWAIVGLDIRNSIDKLAQK